MMQLHTIDDCRDPANSGKGISGPRAYKKPPNVPEGFAESSPCGSIRPWNRPVTPNKSSTRDERVCRELPLWEHPALELSCHIVKYSTDLASHKDNDNRTSPIPSEPLFRVQQNAIDDGRDPANSGKRISGPRAYKKPPNVPEGFAESSPCGSIRPVPEGFAESSPCGSIRPWNCPVTPNKSSTDLASHYDERASPIPSEQLVRQ
jgi:hypothetical protein